MRLLNTTGRDRGAVRRLVVERLMACQAADLKALCESTGEDSSDVKRELDFLIKSKEVEVLRPLPPVSFCNRNDRFRNDSSQVAEHFRLIRETDEDYLWEQEIIAGLPVSRMGKAFGCESGLASERRREASGYFPWLRKVASLTFAVPGF